MKKKWIAALLLGIALTVAGCSDLVTVQTSDAPAETVASTDNALSEAGVPAATEAPGNTATPAQTERTNQTEKPDQTENPAPTENPAQTEEPVQTEAPMQLQEGIPEGFSDQELEERSKAEAASETRFAYYSESVSEGMMDEFGNAAGIFDVAPTVACNKVLSYYDADGNVRMTKYFLDDKEAASETYTHFGTLSVRGGGDVFWSGRSPVSYTEMDARGRKTAELDGGYKYFYAYDEAGRLAASQTFEGDQMKEGLIYVYDAKGNLASMERTEPGDDVLRETLYAYEWDESGRITGVTVSFAAGGMMSNHKYYFSFHYFDNGPVLMVMNNQKGDMVYLEPPAYVFLPNAEIKEMLETGSGFSYPAIEKFLDQSERQFMQSSALLGLRFETILRDHCLYPEEKGRFIDRISQNYTGDSFVTIINRLLTQNEFQMDKSVKTDKGAYCNYDGERLASSYLFDDGEGSGFYEILKYDSAGRPVMVTVGTEYERHYEIAYDKAGRASEVKYDDRDSHNEKRMTGTVTYSYDAAGTVCAVNADFSKEREEDGAKKLSHLTYSLKLLLSD